MGCSDRSEQFSHVIQDSTAAPSGDSTNDKDINSNNDDIHNDGEDESNKGESDLVSNEEDSDATKMRAPQHLPAAIRSLIESKKSAQQAVTTIELAHSMSQDDSSP